MLPRKLPSLEVLNLKNNPQIDYGNVLNCTADKIRRRRVYAAVEGHLYNVHRLSWSIFGFKGLRIRIWNQV
jgi:hypothetical protein